MKVVASLVAFFVSIFPAIAQQSVTLIPSMDNSIYSESGTVSNGAGPNIFSGKNNGGNIRRALVKFDIAGQIPSGAVISSVSLKMAVTNVPASPVTSTVELKKVNAAWGEGTSVASSGGGQGGAASTNDVTWTHRLFDTQNWSSPGGDFSSVVSSSVSISGLGTYEWPSTAQMVADVQGWLNDSSVNFGWIIIGDEVHNQSAKRFDSRTSLTEANRPVLTVGYSIPTSVQGNAVKPAQFVLEQNYPNPFNPTTTITYSVPQTGHVSMTVYDILGNNVATLVDQPKSAGTHSVKFDGSRLSNGVYFYRLRFGNVSAVKKLTLVK